MRKKGISLIVLIITIAVILILVTAVIASVANSGLIGGTKEAVFKNNLSSVVEELDLYKMNKEAETFRKFDKSSLSASEYLVSSNIEVNQNENIYDILPSAKYFKGKLEVVQGELIYTDISENELLWAREVGVDVNPFEIVDGVLKSTKGNIGAASGRTTLVIPSTVTKIDEGAFSDLEGIEEIIIPGTVKEIGKNAFSNNATLKKVTMLDGVQIIGDSAFNKSNIVEVNMPDSVTSVGELAFSGCKNLERIRLSNGLKVLSKAVFDTCASLTNLVIPDSVIELQYHCIVSCPLLTEITFPKNLEIYANEAVLYNKSLNNIILSDENKNFTFEDKALYNKSKKILYYVLPSNVTSYDILDSVETLKSGALYSLSNLKSINIPSTVSTIETNVFPNVTGLNITVSPDNDNFSSPDGNLYNKEQTLLIKYTRNEVTVNIVNTVKQFTSGCFKGNGKIKAINLPTDLEIINGYELFPDLDYLYIPDKVNSIAQQAFLNVKSIEVSEGNKTFKSENNMVLSKDGSRLFLVFDASVTIPTTVTTIESYAFCPDITTAELTEFDIPQGVTTLKESAFSGCNNLKKITVPNSVKSIGANAFAAGKNLTQVIIDNKEGAIAGSPWGASSGARIFEYLRK